MPIKLNSAGGGSVSIDVPSTAATYTLTAPAKTATILTSADSNTVTQSMLSTNITTNGPCFSAYLNGNQNISTGTFVKVNLNTKEWDTANCFDTTNNRFTPNVAGYYQINACIYITYSTAGGGVIQSTITKNGGSVRYSMSGYVTSGNVGEYGMYPLSSLVYLNGTTDFVDLYGYASAGTGYNFQGGAGYTWMNGFLARAA